MNIYEALCNILGSEGVLCNEMMNTHTTFRTGGPADYLVNPKADQLPAVIEACREADVPYTILGNGSNVLVADAGIEGVVIELAKQMAEIEITEDGIITAEAGAMLTATALRACQAGYTGMEFATGIPGSIGGAVFMNAGAYGGEIKDVIVSADVLTPEGKVETLSKEELDLSYRHSSVSDRGCIVLKAVFSLQKGDREAIDARVAELKEKRTTKQPLEYPSAGSTFKRPEGYFAGKLIEDAGLRGFSLGGAQVAMKHCGFVINKDHATSADVVNLMKAVSDKVYEKFGVRLEAEVRMLGRF